MKVLTNRDWNRVDAIFKHKTIAVLDDFLRPGFCEQLHSYATTNKKRHTAFPGYMSLRLAPNGYDEWLPLLQDIVDESLQYVPFLRTMKFNRGWFFDYEPECDGVRPHCDPGSQLTFNLWVTKDQSMLTSSTEELNGLSIWKEHKTEGTNPHGVPEESHKLDPSIRTYIPYKFNRLVIFPSSYIHGSGKVRTLKGREHQRVNYTLMYGDIRNGVYR